MLGPSLSMQKNLEYPPPPPPPPPRDSMFSRTMVNTKFTCVIGNCVTPLLKQHISSIPYSSVHSMGGGGGGKQ